jgi:hypothetical protein
MPIAMRWYQPDKILLIEYKGSIEADEIMANLWQVLTYLDGCSDKLHLIITLEDLVDSPVAPATIPEIIKIIRHANIGRYTVVGAPPFIAHWLKVLGTIGFQALPFPSVEDAAAYLNGL